MSDETFEKKHDHHEHKHDEKPEDNGKEQSPIEPLDDSDGGDPTPGH